MADNSIDERRQFSRVAFDAVAHLHRNNEAHYLHCPVIDVSLKGILLSKPADWTGALGQDYDIDLLLGDAQVVIKMHSTVAHIGDDAIGFTCQQLDIDSMTHLKQLVALNLGDIRLLERELHSLIAL